MPYGIYEYNEWMKKNKKRRKSLVDNAIDSAIDSAVDIGTGIIKTISRNTRPGAPSLKVSTLSSKKK